jgi:AAA domain
MSPTVRRKPTSLAQAEAHYAVSVGHIDQEHPLSPSQREAMTELVALEAGHVLAVNGPPGTGKTTLLQSVVAQLWVEAALQKTVCPLIVITSTNVKAVENVLDSFAKIGSKIGHQRWLPYDGGFGLFMASTSRETKFPTCTSDTHPFVEHETAEAVASARNAYLGRASAYFGKQQDSVEVVVKELHAELKGYQETTQKIVKARYAIFSATGNDTQTGAVTVCTQSMSQYEREAATEQALIESSEADIARNKEHNRAVEAKHEAVRAGIDAAERGWSEYLAASPLWLDLLSFLPPVLRRRNARDRLFLLTNPLTAEMNDRQEDITGHFRVLRKKTLTDKQAELANLATDLTRAEEEKASALARLNTARQGHARIKKLLKNWRDALDAKYEQMADICLVALNDKLDTAIRAPMFCVADRYWSGRWLLEMQGRLEKQLIDSKGPGKLAAKYRRFAMLSPCLVSNFHMAPAFFTEWQAKDVPVPMWNMIDMLVVDEAGQVSPDVGAGMFALAKRALVVGDTHQIEPVWSTGEATDRANAKKFNLTARTDDPCYDYDKLAIAGYTAAQGNLMKISGRSCIVQKYDDVRGLLLTEHRRCVPELVAYCNALVYAGRLQPLRPALDPASRILPAFGRLDVQGRDKKVGTSRQNHDEAAAIVAWLKDNRERIENHYRDKETQEKMPLWRSVGVVTPFSTQANLIERLLRKAMPDLARKNTKLTVGTVHALQGAERNIVIFSPTYGQGYNGGIFFDKSPNMLNVAVSRAKDSFLVIGNLALFDQTKKSKPSGLLATYLSDPKNSGLIS